MRNEFWLAVHQLADAYGAEGLTPDERLERILGQFDGMPAVARREVLADLALLAYSLSDVYVAAISRGRELDEQPTTPKKAGA